MQMKMQMLYVNNSLNTVAALSFDLKTSIYRYYINILNTFIKCHSTLYLVYHKYVMHIVLFVSVYVKYSCSDQIR